MPVCDLRTDFRYNTGKFMAGDMGQFDVGVKALPAPPVTAAYACGMYFYQDACGWGNWWFD
jgi:hypothetical protein